MNTQPWPRLAAYAAVLVFWCLTLWHLDRFPPLHEDEAWILSPGYKLFSQGVYGSDMFTGYYGMEKYYLEFMPLMSVLQGGVARLAGLGVLQMRYAPAALGTLTLALTFALARRLASDEAGGLALGLLLFWQWMPGGALRLASGVPWLDLSRIARYDILAAFLGLCSLYSFCMMRNRRRSWGDAWIGLLVGLTGLAHLYGLFWVIIFSTLIWVEGSLAGRPVRSATRRLGLMLSGVGAAWLVWIWLLVSYWDDFVGQLQLDADRFDLASLSFYIHNLLTEGQRYSLVRDAAALTRIGFWLLAVGVPAAGLWVCLDALQRPQHRRRAAWLLTPCALYPLLLALLIEPKTFNYLATLIPLFAILLASGLCGLLRMRQWAGRAFVLVLLGLIVAQGRIGIWKMQEIANQTPPPADVFAELRQIVPASPRVLGPPQYWLAFADHDYRSLALPFFLAETKLNSNPPTFGAALVQITPHIILLDPIFRQVLTDCSLPVNCARSRAFWSYMQQHRARLLRTLPDGQGGTVQVYQLDG